MTKVDGLQRNLFPIHSRNNIPNSGGWVGFEGVRFVWFVCLSRVSAPPGVFEPDNRGASKQIARNTAPGSAPRARAGGGPTTTTMPMPAPWKPRHTPVSPRPRQLDHGRPLQNPPSILASIAKHARASTTARLHPLRPVTLLPQNVPRAPPRCYFLRHRDRPGRRDPILRCPVAPNSQLTRARTFSPPPP